MSVNVEKTSELGRKITMTIPAEEIEQRLNNKLKEIAKTAKMDGFREGKVPVSIIKQRYEKPARDEVVGDLIKQSLYDSLTKEGLKPVGTPKIDLIQAEEGKPLEYTASFEIFPEVKLPDLASINIENIKVDISEKDMDIMLERLRKQYPVWKEVTRPAKHEDRLLIDFVGRVNNEAFPGGTAQDVHLILGSNQFIPGFEEGLLTAEAGDEKIIKVKFPENYHAKDLAGKDSEFTVNVKKVEEAQLPELNEDFAKMLGVENGSLDELREKVKEQMDLGSRQVVRGKMKSQVFEKLAALMSISLPQSLIDMELDHLHQEHHAHEKNQTTHEHHSAHDHPELVDEAKKRVQLALLIGELVRHFEIKIDQERVRAMITDLAKIYDEPQQVINWYLNDPSRLAPIQSAVIEDQVLDKLLDTMKVVEQSLSYDEIMQQRT
jgi:trigger factor